MGIPERLWTWFARAEKAPLDKEWNSSLIPFKVRAYVEIQWLGFDLPIILERNGDASRSTYVLPDRWNSLSKVHNQSLSGNDNDLSACIDELYWNVD